MLIFKSALKSDAVSSVAKSRWLLTVSLQVIFILLCNESTAQLASGQLEAVGAVMSVVPVTNILATAGLMGVKLVAISRLLQMLGYDRAYLASGGSGSAAQPIGLQTKYAYMFPYVPGLNISVKGEHSGPYDNNQPLGQPQQQQQVQLPVEADKTLAGPDPGKGASRKTYPAMGLPGDYENQQRPFRGSDTLQKIFKDAGLKVRIPAQQNRGNVQYPQQKQQQQQQHEQQQQLPLQDPNKQQIIPTQNVAHHRLPLAPSAAILAASVGTAQNANQLSHPVPPAPISAGFDRGEQPSSSSFPSAIPGGTSSQEAQQAPPATVHFHHPQTSQLHSGSQQTAPSTSTHSSSTIDNINNQSPSSQVIRPNHHHHPHHHPSRYSPSSSLNPAAPVDSSSNAHQQVAEPSRRKPQPPSLFPPQYQWQHPDPYSQLLQHYPIPQHDYYFQRLRSETETRRQFELQMQRLRDQQQQPPVVVRPQPQPPRPMTTKRPAIHSGSLIPAPKDNLDIGNLFDDFGDAPSVPTIQSKPVAPIRAPSDSSRPSPITTNTNIVDRPALSTYSDGHSPPYHDELDDQNRTPFFAARRRRKRST